MRGLGYPLIAGVAIVLTSGTVAVAQAVRARGCSGEELRRVVVEAAVKERLVLTGL